MSIKLYTPKEVAKIFGVDPVTVRRWMAVGKLSYIKLGDKNSSVRFTDEQLRGFIESHRKGAKNE